MRPMPALLVCCFLACSLLCATAHAQAAAEPGQTQFLILLKLAPRLADEQNWTDADRKAVSDHFHRLKRMRDEGKVILAGPTLNADSPQFGIVVVEVAGEEEARVVMDEDPAVLAGVMTGQLFPFRVALLREAGGQ